VEAITVFKAKKANKKEKRREAAGDRSIAKE
jgi:hypothetical protein